MTMHKRALAAVLILGATLMGVVALACGPSASDVPFVRQDGDHCPVGGCKEGGIGPVIHMTGDVRRDMDAIRAFYATIAPKHPHQWATPRLAEELEGFSEAMAEAAED